MSQSRILFVLAVALRISLVLGVALMFFAAWLAGMVRDGFFIVGVILVIAGLFSDFVTPAMWYRIGQENVDGVFGDRRGIVDE